MSKLQWKASNPDCSVWVSASAGTGKTKILTDRVLRLLLKGADPRKILCLTFTNAAASEMQHRIDNELAQWAAADEAHLEQNLKSLLASKPNNRDLQIAKGLFGNSLKPNCKIEIHTIHSYCQKILKRFPLEANISPGFQIIDDIKAGEILDIVRNRLYLDDDHDEIMNFFTANFHETTLKEILDNIINQKLKFKNYQNKSDNLPYISQQDKLFNPPNDFKEIQKLCAELKKMMGSSKLAYDKKIKLPKIMEADINNEAEVLSAFLNKDGGKTQRIISKKISDENPDLIHKFQECQDRIYQYDQSLKNQQMIKYSKLLKNLAEIFIGKYEEYKIANGFLDYDDLIYYTKNLFNQSHVRDWVLYKLDGGIDHLLVDEAQDTSPYQWDIINALIAEFYAGESARDNERTIFVVGDEKQSIFSFQGANLDSLNLTNSKLKQKLLAAQKKYENISLEYSYRSVSTIIESVYNIFSYIKKSLPDFFSADNPKIIPFRKDHDGKVELWPLVQQMKVQKFFWPKPEGNNNFPSAQQQLAKMIAGYIKSQIDGQEILPATRLPARAEDFMILVRKRDSLATEIISELKNQSLQTAGIDRMLLSENLSVMDLIAVARFALSPHDDLNLAVLIKSPFIGLSDATLGKVINLQESESLWQTLGKLNNQDADTDFSFIWNRLQFFLQLYNICDCSNFFHMIVDSFDYRHILIKINGADSNDAINELLYLSHNYACNINNSVQSFIYWFETNEIEIKRNVQSSDKIKIMTVHGSKGLQAPVVILCDTTSIPTNKTKFYHDENGELMAVQKSSAAPSIFSEYKDLQYLKDLQEYVRLLYVAMTRPQDHLIICGYQPKEKLPPYCWYSLAANSLQVSEQVSSQSISNDVSEIVGQNNLQYPVNSLIPNFESEKKQSEMINDKTTKHLPQHLLLDKLLESRFLPSSVVQSPLINTDYLEYGKVFHKMLEDCVKAANLSNLNSHPLISLLDKSQQEKIRKSIEILLSKGELQYFISGKVRTEVNIGIKVRGKIKLGRIDLLCVTDNEIIIIDYKSDGSPPTLETAIPLAYVEQLNFYKKAVEKIYKGCTVKAMILWLACGEFVNVN